MAGEARYAEFQPSFGEIQKTKPSALTVSNMRGEGGQRLRRAIMSRKANPRYHQSGHFASPKWNSLWLSLFLFLIAI